MPFKCQIYIMWAAAELFAGTEQAIVTRLLTCAKFIQQRDSQAMTDTVQRHF